MATGEVDVRDQIIAFKRKLAPNRDVLKRAFADVKDHVTRAADAILRETAAGRPVVPELEYQCHALESHGDVSQCRSLNGHATGRKIPGSVPRRYSSL